MFFILSIITVVLLKSLVSLEGHIGKSFDRTDIVEDQSSMWQRGLWSDQIYLETLKDYPEHPIPTFLSINKAVIGHQSGETGEKSTLSNSTRYTKLE